MRQTWAFRHVPSGSRHPGPTKAELMALLTLLVVTASLIGVMVTRSEAHAQRSAASQASQTSTEAKTKNCGRTTIGGILGTLKAARIRCKTARRVVRTGLSRMRKSNGKLGIYKTPRVGSFTCRFLNLKPGGSIICESTNGREAFFPFTRDA